MGSIIQRVTKYVDRRLDKNFYRLQVEYQQNVGPANNGFVPVDVCLRQFYSSTYLLNKICDKTGVVADLGKCFDSIVAQIMSLAYYLVLEEEQPMYRFLKTSLWLGYPILAKQ